jgi:hypothetical protein
MGDAQVGGGRASATAREQARAQAEARSRWRFGARTRKAILVSHIAISVALIGNTASVIVLAIRAASIGSVEANALYELGGVMAFALAIPLSFGALFTGMALGVGTTWGLIRYYWVVTKAALLVAIILVGSFIVGPSLEALADSSSAGLQKGGLGDERWWLMAGGLANIVFMLSAVIFSVFKPWGRIRGR